MTLRAWLKALVSAAIGGAAGALSNFLTGAGGDYTKIDWHRLAIYTGVGGLIAVANYLVKSPLEPGGK